MERKKQFIGMEIWSSLKHVSSDNFISSLDGSNHKKQNKSQKTKQITEKKNVKICEFFTLCGLCFSTL